MSNRVYVLKRERKSKVEEGGAPGEVGNARIYLTLLVKREKSKGIGYGSMCGKMIVSMHSPLLAVYPQVYNSVHSFSLDVTLFSLCLSFKRILF